VPILPVFGSEDVPVLFNPPQTGDKAQFYGDWFKIFFTDVAGNSDFAAGINTDFLDYGSYRYDVPNSKVTFLNINSLYFTFANAADSTITPPLLLSWMDTILSENRKFIINMHVPPAYLGISQLGFGIQFFDDAYQSNFLDMLVTHKSKINAIFAGGINISAVMAPKSSTKNVATPLFIFPAVSPRLSNPGYSTLVIDS
jgi:hypothetical protein